jgi:hypothetical protein
MRGQLIVPTSAGVLIAMPIVIEGEHPAASWTHVGLVVIHHESPYSLASATTITPATGGDSWN